MQTSNKPLRFVVHGVNDEPNGWDLVPVICGANEQPFPALGQTVGQIRAMATEVLNIPTGAEARVGGTLVGDDHVVGRDQPVEFVKPAGRFG